MVSHVIWEKILKKNISELCSQFLSRAWTFQHFENGGCSLCDWRVKNFVNKTSTRHWSSLLKTPANRGSVDQKPVKMPSLVEIIGDTLLDNTGKSVATSDLQSNGKIVGLFFSASWCPPCIGFGPKLKEFYNKFRDKLSVVFISSDKDEECFTEYFNEMPWFAIPFQERDKKVSS